MNPDEFDTTLLAAQAGAAWACTRLYEELKRPVAAFVRFRGVPDPDDVTSEVFLHVFRDLGGFTGEEQDFRAWVFLIARRRVADEWRRRSRRPRETALPDGFDVPADGASTDPDVGLDPESRAALDALTDAQREVVLLRIIADLSIQQVADATGRSVLSVKALQHRATSALQRQFRDDAQPHRSERR